MQRVQNIQIDGAGLLDGIGGSARQESFDFGSISTGTEKVYETEKLTKGEKTAEVIYQKPQKESKAGTASDVMQQADKMDTASMKDQMVVASNTTTAADCKKVEEEGFSLQQTDIRTVVTVTDKIKMELAKAGVDVSSFGGGLSAEQIEAFAGNAALAQKIAGRIEQLAADIPLTQDNAADFVRALEEAGELQQLNDGALKYMLDNQLKPTIANLYKAQYSGSTVYVNQNTDQVGFEGIKEQVSRIIAQSGRKEDERALADSQWLMQNQIPLTAQNLNYIDQLKEMDFPLDTEKLLDQMITAVAEGKRPQDAVLLDAYSLTGQAQKAVEVIQQTTDEDLAYVISKGEPVTIQNLEQAHNQNQTGISAAEKEEITQLIQSTEEAQKNIQTVQTSEETAGEVHEEGVQTDSVNIQTSSVVQVSQADTADDSFSAIQIALITARRQLEEIRMEMTIDASYKMLKYGISLDTSPMEELIFQLREIENNFYKTLLKEGGVEASQANVTLFAQTTARLEELKEMPAYALGARNMQISTLTELHQEGSAMQQNFQQANERYETMQTEIRKDLGDSIQKAFRNVDDILEQLGQEASPANERAVRILGYNRIEITAENESGRSAGADSVS